MRKVLCLLLVMFVLAAPMVAQRAEAVTSFECTYARFNPVYAVICAIQWATNIWLYGHGGDADGLGG